MKKNIIFALCFTLFLLIPPIALASNLDPDKAIASALGVCHEEAIKEGRSVRMIDGEPVIYGIWMSRGGNLSPYNSSDTFAYIISIEYGEMYPGCGPFEESLYLYCGVREDGLAVVLDHDAPMFFASLERYPTNLRKLGKKVKLALSDEDPAVFSPDEALGARINAAMRYLDANVADEGLLSVDGIPFKRSAQLIDCAQRATLPEAYQKYDYVLTLGYLRMKVYSDSERIGKFPLPYFEHVSIGLKGDALEVCPTPDELRARAFSGSLFDDVIVQRLF